MTLTEARLREALLLLAASWGALTWHDQTRGYPRAAQAWQRAATEFRDLIERT